MCSIMTWKVTLSVLIKVDKVAVCGSCDQVFESTSHMPRNMESGKPSNQSARGVDIPPTTRNLVFRTRTDVQEYVPHSGQEYGHVVAQQMYVLNIGCAYGPTVACGGPDPRVGMKGKRLLRSDYLIFQACELGLPLQGYETRFRIVHFSYRLRLLAPSAT
jgi:hypothetical protein